MVELRRTVRLSINPAAAAAARTGPNGYAGVPAMTGLGRHYEFEATCAGEADPHTGYLVNIKDVDAAVRAEVLPRVERLVAETPAADPARELPLLVAPLAGALRGRLRSLRWLLSPYYSVEMDTRDQAVVLLRQKFDFAAAHRLHIPSLSDQDNRRLFGKCNNATGHGHNYQVEPCIAVRAAPAASPGAPAITLPDLERLTEQVLISRFDHKHLNEDTPEFDPRRGGVNPTIENIARVFYDLLAPAIAAHSKDTSLRSITVWETDRTSATHPA